MTRSTVILVVCLASTFAATTTAGAQSDTLPRWQARYGGGPSFGSPNSDFDGSRPPTQWCLPTDQWGEASLGWLRRVLSDTTEFGDGWRKVLGGAATLRASDSLTVVRDEALCRRAADVVNREVLGWSVGPPPIFLVRVRNGLIAYPSNAQLGEFGQAVALDSALHVLGVATW
jgi:hypothetical protein